ncbi:50S ribosomal protein L25/general stress protein Ctc [Jeotgalibacillus soli]|uniref:Large ribosomal subunit protein bL25 n=1 Tax=Jeotgalibacillus soli TaxID=889306 RepID=A0A0C2SF35_9BACL|nr:50S ribosomal protein L25/general stress protein Ctc [Jeotgalibacillus soli]KIL52514.1 50S ribosomal protein L25 [Jeotgalibacillus soli]
MSSILKATTRKGFKKSDRNGLRKEGKLPAVVYGYNVNNTSIAINEMELIKTIRDVGRNGIIDLDIEGNKQKVVLSDFQSDFLKDQIVHADFLAVNLSSELEVDVSVKLIGESAGAKEGGVVQMILHTLSVSAKPNDIPDSIEVDISKLEIAESISVGDIRDQFQFTMNHEDDETIVTVLTPRVEEKSEENDEADGTESKKEETETN